MDASGAVDAFHIRLLSVGYRLSTPERLLVTASAVLPSWLAFFRAQHPSILFLTTHSSRSARRDPASWMSLPPYAPFVRHSILLATSPTSPPLAGSAFVSPCLATSHVYLTPAFAPVASTLSSESWTANPPPCVSTPSHSSTHSSTDPFTPVIHQRIHPSGRTDSAPS